MAQRNQQVQLSQTKLKKNNMTLFFKPKIKKILLDRNEIFLSKGLVELNELGFRESPFSTSWFGKNNLNDYTYEVCRLASNDILEVIIVEISRGDDWIKIYLNIFKLSQTIDTINELNGLNGLILHLPPYSLSKMRLRIDDYKGIPLFRNKDHKLKIWLTEIGYEKSKKLLGELIQNDMRSINTFIKNWYSIYSIPQQVTVDFTDRTLK